MAKVKSLLAALLCAALAVEPAFSAGLETPTPEPSRGAPAEPVLPFSGANLPLELPTGPSIDAVNLDPAELPTTEVSQAARSQEPPEAERTAQRDAQAQAQPTTQSQQTPRKATASSTRRAEFQGIASAQDGELPQRVWEHAESRGFVHDQALSVWEDEGGAAPPALSSPTPEKKDEKKAPPAPGSTERISVYSGRVLGFLSNFLLLQLAVESLALAVPQMTDPLKNGFIALAGLASTSYFAYAVGSFFGGRLVQKVGLARVYRSVLVIRTLLWTAVGLIYHAHGGSIPIPTLIAFFSGDYLVHSVGRVAERTLQGEWFKDSPVASNRFGTLRDFIEYGTVFTTMGTGLIIAMLGYGAVIYSAPVLFGLAAILAISLRGLPQKLLQKARKVALFAGFKRLFRPEMRTLFLARLLINNFVYLLYYITATAFGVFASHGDKGVSALVASAMIGLLGMGANGAALGNAVTSRRIEKATEGLPEEARPAAQARLMTQSAARALKWAALAMLGGWLFVSLHSFGTIAGPLIALGPFALAGGLVGALVVAAKAAKAGRFFTKGTALNAAKFVGVGLLGLGAVLLKAQAAHWLIWPLFALSPALILIGFTGQLALTQLDTLLLDKFPRRTKGYLVGADRTLLYLSYAINYLIWGVLFQVFGTAALIGLGVYCTLTAVGYWLLAKKLAKS